MKPAVNSAGEGTPKVVQGELDFPLAMDGAVCADGEKVKAMSEAERKWKEHFRDSIIHRGIIPRRGHK